MTAMQRNVLSIHTDTLYRHTHITHRQLCSRFATKNFCYDGNVSAIVCI